MKYRGFLLAMLLAGCLAQSVLAQSSVVRGTIEQLNQDGGTITVSGRELLIQENTTKIFVAGQEVPSHFLDRGMVVDYTLDAEGKLTRLELLGPAEKLRMLEQH